MSGSRSGGAIDPDTSMSSTMLRPVDLARRRARARARRSSTSLCDGAHGQSPISVVSAIGWPPRGAGVREAEVVDELFDAHGVARRQLAAREEPAHVRVRRGVHVGAERRERLVARELEAIRFETSVRLARVREGRPDLLERVEVLVPRRAVRRQIGDRSAFEVPLRRDRRGGRTRLLARRAAATSSATPSVHLHDLPRVARRAGRRLLRVDDGRRRGDGHLLGRLPDLHHDWQSDDGRLIENREHADKRLESVKLGAHAVAAGDDVIELKLALGAGGCGRDDFAVAFERHGDAGEHPERSGPPRNPQS